MNYTQEQIDRANAVNLEQFLRSQGEALIRSGNEYRWKAHDSLTIRENKWYRHSQSKGGFPIDFVMEFYGKSFPETVEMLLGEKGTETVSGSTTDRPASTPAPEFRLPMRSDTNDIIMNYLTKDRGISEALVQQFIDAGDIYEDAVHHNVVFVGRDPEGHPRYAHCRGTKARYRADVTGSDKAYGFAYRGPGEDLVVFEAPIDLLSFIELHPRDWQQHSYIALGGVSGKALMQFLSDRKDIRNVWLCLDADDAGWNACMELGRQIPKGITLKKGVPAMKDWNEVLLHRSHFPEDQPYQNWYADMSVSPVPMIRISDVEQTDVKWLWKPYIPFGKVSVLQGNPGEGKTYFAMNLVAACTNGRLLPGMEPMKPFNVIYQTAEDGLGDTIKPRLIEAGADLNRVLVINDQGEQLSMKDWRLEPAIRENRARLVILDPIQAFLGADVDMNRANEIRPLLMRLGSIAERTGAAILLIGHLNKAAGMQSLQRGLGSIDIAAAVRSVMFIGKLRQDPNVRVLTHEKSSLAPPGESLAFSLGDEDGFHWIGPYDITSDEMLAGVEPRRENKTNAAKAMICTMLADGKHMLSEEIDRAALEKGIASRTVRDAKRDLGDRLKSRIVEGRRKEYWME